MATEILELQLRVSGGNVAASQFGTLEKSANGAANAMRLVRNALVLASGIRLASGLFEMVDAFQRMQNQLNSVLGSVALTNTAFNDLYNIAQRTRSPLDSTITLFSRMARAGAALHINLGDVETAVAAVNESFVINAATANESRNAVLQLSHELASGQVRGRSLLSVIQSGPAIAQAFADEMFKLGLTTDKYGEKVQLAGAALYNFVKAHQGLLTGRIAFQALVDGAQKIQEQMDRTLPTIGQVATQSHNALLYLMGTLLNASGLLGGFGETLLWIKDNLGALIGVITAGAAAFAAWGILDVITAQFAHLGELKGLFAFMLSPLANVVSGLKNLAIIAGNVVLGFYGMGRAMVKAAEDIVDAAGRAARFVAQEFSTAVSVVSQGFLGMVRAVAGAGSAFVAVTAFVSDAAIVFSSLLNFTLFSVVAMKNLTTALGALTSGFSLTAGAASLVAKFLEYTLVTTTALGTEAIGTISTISTGFRQLVTVTGSVTAAFTSMGAAALAALGNALLSAFASIIVLLPVMLIGVEAITLAFSGLIAIGGGLLSLGNVFDTLAGKTASWHDIVNSFLSLLFVAFDVLANHLPLVFGAVNEQWHRLIADMISVLPTIFAAIKGYLVEPMLTFIRVLADLAPVVGALAGAAAGGPVGAVIGALAGGAAGIAAQHFRSEISDQFDALGAQADALVAKAAGQVGHSFSDQLVAVVKDDMTKYGKEDFARAFNLLGQGMSLDKIAALTGVQIGDLKRVKDLKNTFLPSPGVVPEDPTTPKRDPLAALYDQDRQALDDLAQSVSPYAKSVADLDKTDKVFDKITRDNVLLAASGRKVLDVGEQLAKLGLNRETIENRTARAVLGVGNAMTDYLDKLRLANDELKKGIITQDEYTAAMLKAHIVEDDAVVGGGRNAIFAGITSATSSNKLANFNVEPIAKSVIESATSSSQAIAKYKIEVEALNDALYSGAISQKQFDNQLRDSSISVLDAQTDAVSGYDRALLKMSKQFSNTAADMERTVTGLVGDIDDQLTSLLQGKSFDFSKVLGDLQDNVARNLSHQILSPILTSLSNQGGILGDLAGFAGDTLSKPDGSAAAPFHVIVADTLLGGAGINGGGGILGNLLHGGSSSGGGAGGIGDIGSKLGGFISNLFSGGGGAGSTSSSILNFLGMGTNDEIVKVTPQVAFAGADAASASAGSWLSSAGDWISSLFGFKTGGEFDVGGSGSSDSQLVAFRATPGEHVSIGQPSSGGGDVNVMVYDQRTSSGSKPVDTQTSVGSDGKKQLKIFITDTVNEGFAAGKHDTTMQNTFGLSRAGRQA